MARYVDHYKGERKQDRRTPQEFFAKLNDRFQFTMDGAATVENALLPKFSSPDSQKSWISERVFCNPPWSNIPEFVELADYADLAVLLVPARTNCGWFHRALELGATVEFWKGKLNFGGKWNSPIDCLLLIFTKDRGENGETLGTGRSSERQAEPVNHLSLAGSTPADLSSISTQS